jgi:hypothetical protein
LTVSVIRGAAAANRLEIGGVFSLASNDVVLGRKVVDERRAARESVRSARGERSGEQQHPQ